MDNDIDPSKIDPKNIEMKKLVKEIISNEMGKQELLKGLKQALPEEFFTVFRDLLDHKIPYESEKDIKNALNIMADNVLDSYNSGKIDKENMAMLLRVLEAFKKQKDIK